MPDVWQLMVMHTNAWVLKNAWCQVDYAAVPDASRRPNLKHLSAGMALDKALLSWHGSCSLWRRRSICASEFNSFKSRNELVGCFGGAGDKHTHQLWACRPHVSASAACHSRCPLHICVALISRSQCTRSLPITPSSKRYIALQRVGPDCLAGGSQGTDTHAQGSAAVRAAATLGRTSPHARHRVGRFQGGRGAEQRSRSWVSTRHRAGQGMLLPKL